MSVKNSFLKRLAIYKIRKHGFWFIDIPRTSSSSIKSALGTRYGGAYGKSNIILGKDATHQWLPDHLTSVEMRNLVGAQAWRSINSFTIIRNPFDRILSLYLFLNINNQIPKAWGFEDYLVEMERGKSKFLSYRPLTATCYDFCTDENKKILVKNIFKYEYRSEVLGEIIEITQCPEIHKIWINNSPRSEGSYKDYYNKKTKAIVEKLFYNDLNHFGYNF